MWREMSLYHKAQLKAVEAIGRLENSAAFGSTTSFHRQATSQLELALNKYAPTVLLSLLFCDQLFFNVLTHLQYNQN